MSYRTLFPSIVIKKYAERIPERYNELRDNVYSMRRRFIRKWPYVGQQLINFMLQNTISVNCNKKRYGRIPERAITNYKITLILRVEDLSENTHTN